MTDYMDTYRKDWKEIVEQPDGTLSLDQVARELHDYSGLMERAFEVYSSVTDDRISKLGAPPQLIIDIVNERIDAAGREVIEELTRNLEGDARGFTSMAEVIALIRELTGFPAAS